MKWADFLSEVREELDDTSASPKWSDAILYTYTREALSDYSRHLPYKKYGVVLTRDVSNTKKYALPPDFMFEFSVESPAGKFLEPLRSRPGVLTQAGHRILFYRVEPPYLYVDAETSDDLILGYGAYHLAPAGKDDSTFALTFPLEDAEIIKLYLEAKINSRIRNSQARLDRFKIGAGSRTDNPIANEVEDFFARYREKLAMRVTAQSVELSRKRKYR
jgi:hypothetical protein